LPFTPFAAPNKVQGSSPGSLQPAEAVVKIEQVFFGPPQDGQDSSTDATPSAPGTTPGVLKVNSLQASLQIVVESGPP